AAFTNETSAGWQQVNFSRPVAIQPNTVYVVSFSTGGGYFGVTTTSFATRGVDSGPLHALADGVSGGDGGYQSAGSFPNVSGAGMNCWADIVFVPSSSTTAARSVSLAPSPVAQGGRSFGIAPTAGSDGFNRTTGSGAVPAGPSRPVDWWTTGRPAP